jgi:ABC-type hemin transport system substrate-binding protein
MPVPPETLQALRAAGVDVVTVPAAQTLDAVRDNVRRIAGALGAGEQARVLLDDLDRRAATLAARRLDAPPMLLLREGEGGLRVAGEGTTGAALIAPARRRQRRRLRRLPQLFAGSAAGDGPGVAAHRGP